MLNDKIERAKDLIGEWHTESLPATSAFLCSFGKDSMVLLHLIRETLPENPLGYPVPVIYYRYPWFPAKNQFADDMIRAFNMVVHDYPPAAAGIKYDDKHLELVARYHFGSAALDVPLNTLPPMPRRAFVCGLYDWVCRPRMAIATFPWTTIYSGHKSSDIDPMDGPVPLNTDRAAIGQVNLVFPLRDWTDDDVWDYILKHHVPYDKRRYQDGVENPDKWLNPDYIHACTACIDPRDTALEVWCPKLGKMVLNVGSKVVRLQDRPAYVSAPHEATQNEGVMT